MWLLHDCVVVTGNVLNLHAAERQPFPPERVALNGCRIRTDPLGGARKHHPALIRLGL